MNIPNFVSSLRLAAAPLLLALAWLGHGGYFLALLLACFASDALDGYLARRWGQQTELGARLDTLSDTTFYLVFPLGAWWLWPEVMRREAVAIGAVVAAYVLPFAVALARFHAPTSYHTWATKAGVASVGASLLLLFAGGPAWPLYVSAPIAVLAGLEEAAITLVLDRNRADVRSLWHALRLRREADCPP